MSSILYSTESPVESGNVISGLEILGIQSEASVTSESAEGIGIGTVKDLLEKSAKFDFLESEVVEEVFESGSEGVSKALDTELEEAEVLEPIVEPGFGRSTSKLEFFSGGDNADAEVSIDGESFVIKGVSVENDLNGHEPGNEYDDIPFADDQGYEIF